MDDQPSVRHSPLPWSFRHGFDQHDIADEDGNTVFVLNTLKDVANAKLAIASVNACRGFEIERLEKIVASGFRLLDLIRQTLLMEHAGGKAPLPPLGRLFRRLLLRVDWQTCKVKQSLVVDLPPELVGILEEAARQYKAAGGEWEEWT